MSHANLEEFLMEVQMGLRYQVQVDLGKLGEIDFLKAYSRPEATLLTPEKLGRHIDDGLVECIRFELWGLEAGVTDVERFKSKMDAIEEGIKAHPALFAFKMSLWKEKEGEVPLPSAKYLELASRHIRYGAKSVPSIEEGSQIARVLLAPFMNSARWETDWDRERYVRVQAVSWLGSRDLADLRYYILASELSPVAWDTLKAICQHLVTRGEEDVPRELLMWNLWADYGLRQRPAEVPAPRHRPPALGYILRNNEIRHTVDLLARVGMPKTDGCRAVAEATHLGRTYVPRIYRQPYATFADRGMDAMKRLEPSLYAFLYGPGSDSGLAQALRTFLESKP